MTVLSIHGVTGRCTGPKTAQSGRRKAYRGFGQAVVEQLPEFKFV
jgi:hypothetical protein